MGSGQSAWSSPPDPRLAGQVVSYADFVSTSESGVLRAQRPVSIIPLIICFDAPYELVSRDRSESDRYHAFIAGLYDRTALVQSGRVERCIQIDFTPLGMRRLFGLQMDEIARQTLELGDVLGAKRGAPVSRPIEWAWSQLVETHGRRRVGVLTEQIGWSRKRLVAAFRTDIGLPPKAVARLLRFEYAHARLLAGEDTLSIALRAGFSDQAHLIREFVEFTGLTPGRLLAEPAEHETILQS